MCNIYSNKKKFKIVIGNYFYNQIIRTYDKIRSKFITLRRIQNLPIVLKGVIGGNIIVVYHIAG